MSLKIDKTHKKIDTKHLKKEKAKKLSVAFTTLLLSLTMFSGCSKKNNEKIKPSFSDSKSSVSDALDDDFVTSDDVLASSGVYFSDSNSNVYNLSEEQYLDVDNDKKDNIVKHAPDDVIKLENASFIYFDNGNLVSSINEFRYEDLSRIESLTVVLKDGVNYDYLNYLTGLKKIDIIDQTVNDKIDYIDGSIFSNALDISFEPMLYDNVSTFNLEKFSFLKDIPSINSLSLGSHSAYNLDSDFLKELNNVHNLKICVDENTNLKNIDFTHLDSLELLGKPYNVAMYVSAQDIINLRESGVNIKYDNMDELLQISSKLDDIYSGLNITDELNDREKLDTILTFVLKDYTYDSKIKEYNEKGIPHAEETQKFYQDGYLYGALNSETQICGNYASITHALCKRAGLSSYFLTSINHAWDAVKVGDYYYYVDPTWLDGQTITFTVPGEIHTHNGGVTISFGTDTKSVEEIFLENDEYKKRDVSWYLENPFELPQSSDIGLESHDPKFIPTGLELVDVPVDVRKSVLSVKVEPLNGSTTNVSNYDNVPDITNKKFKLTINGKTFIVTGIVLSGILSALGIGALVNKKKEKERKRELRKYLLDNNIDYFPSNDLIDSNNSYNRKR